MRGSGFTVWGLGKRTWKLLEGSGLRSCGQEINVKDNGNHFLLQGSGSEGSGI